MNKEEYNKLYPDSEEIDKTYTFALIKAVDEALLRIFNGEKS